MKRHNMTAADRKAILGIALAMSIIFIFLTVYVSANPINDFDTSALRFLQSQGWAQIFNTTNNVITSSGFRLIYILLAIIFILKNRYSLLSIVVAALSSELISFAIKKAISRPRPTARIVEIYDPTSGFSFISGHTLEYTILFGSLGLVALINTEDKLKRYMMAGVLFLLPIIVGLGRIYSGAHWLTDVIGSYLIGSVILIVLVCYCGRTFAVHRSPR